MICNLTIIKVNKIEIHCDNICLI